MASIASPSSEPGAVLGLQEPRLRVVPNYVSSAGQEAIEVAAIAGLYLDPWERLVLVDALGERPDGKWAAFEVGTEVPRQNGKGSILEARELAGVFAFGEKLLIHSAHEQLTATNHFNRLLDLMEGVPDFDRRILKVVRGKGSEAIWFRGGQAIFFRTRTGGSGRGLTGDFVGLDEAMILPVETTGALVPTMAARSILGNPQLWYAWSAVDKQNPKHDGVVATRLRNRALAGVAGIAYFNWSADVKGWLEARGLRFDPDRPEIDQVTSEVLDDPELYAQANPGLGIRISLEHIERERSGALGAREFAVERLGICDPPETDEAAGRVIGAQLWIACEERNRENRITSAQAFSIDTNIDQTWGSVGVGGQRDDGRWQVHVVKHNRGKDWIIHRNDAGGLEGAAIDLQSEFPESPFAMDPHGPAANLIPDLREAGIRVVEMTTQDYGTACADFVAAVVEDRLRYPAPAPELSDSVADARKQPLGDRWKWSRKNSTSADISPLVACTNALWAAMNAEPEYATVLYGSDHQPTTEDPEIGPAYHHVGVGAPRVLTQEDVTSCFACRVGGCTIHGG